MDTDEASRAASPVGTELESAVRRIVQRIAGTEEWLTAWGLVQADRALVSPWRSAGPDAAAVPQDDPEDLLLAIAQAPYVWPDMEARLINAARVRAARQRLISQGSFSVRQLAETLGRRVNTVYKRLQRAADRAELFTVVVDGERHVPAVLLDEALDPREEWQPVIEALQASRMSGWAMWGWIAEPNAGLSGEIAAEVIEAQTERVHAAARRRLVQATS